ncbi:MAG: hypothetical protein ABI301_02325 [Jatrophihabitantaceae bacterium]
MTGPTPPEWGQPPSDRSTGPGGYAQPQYGQPQYGQPQYGQPQHAQSPMGPMTTRFAKLDPGPSYTFGAVGAAVAVLGAIAIGVAFTAVDWFTHAIGDGPSHFSDIHAALKKLNAVHAANSLSSAYFSWLGWALFAVAVIAAIIACAPGATSALFKAISALTALAGIVLTLVAIDLVKRGTAGAPSYTEYLKHSRLGVYLSLAGFVLVAVGALIGPRRAK